MTSIETVAKPDHSPEVTVTHSVEFPISTPSFAKADLEAWLGKLPKGARVKFTGISNGKLMFVAEWKTRL